MDHQTGFTLVELMIVVSILAIFSAIAFPSMTDSIATNRVRTQSQSIMSALAFARSEAISRGEVVTVTPTNGWRGGANITVARPLPNNANNVLLLKQLAPLQGNTVVAPAGAITVDARGNYAGNAISVRHADTTSWYGLTFNDGVVSLTVN